MESQPQNPEFRKKPENFHPCTCVILVTKPYLYFIRYFDIFKLHNEASRPQIK